MRPDAGADQAEGLRRLLVRARHGEAEPSGAGVPASRSLPQPVGHAGNVPGARVIAVVAGKPGVGRTSVTLNLAAALARSGKNVLVLDENHAPNNLAGRLGLPGRYDLLDAARGKCAPREAVLAARGFSVLSAARAADALAQLGRDGRQRLQEALAEAGGGADVILVDAAMPVPNPSKRLKPGLAGQAVSSGLAGCAELVVVADVTASGITESYALIKRLALENAHLHFGIVVNKAAGERAAKTAFGNMAKVARHNLAAHLEYLGAIPRDDRQVGGAFPGAVQAQSYLELSQKLLRLPVCQDETGGGARAIVRGLAGQAPNPPRQHSREMPLVVN